MSEPPLKNRTKRTGRLEMEMETRIWNEAWRVQQPVNAMGSNS